MATQKSGNKFYLLQHGIGGKLLLYSSIRNAEHVINYMYKSVGDSDIWLLDCSINASPFNSDSLIVVIIGDHIEVQEATAGQRGYLEYLRM